MHKRIKLLILFLLLCSIITPLAIASWGISYFHGKGPSWEPATVIIRKGSSVRDIASTLSEAGVIAYPSVFMLIARMTGEHRSLKAGEYVFEPYISPEQVMEKMTDGEVVIRKVTVPEGFTTHEALALVQNAEGLTGDIPADIKEGSLLPETYLYTYGDTRAAVIGRMQENMQKLLGESWPLRTADLPFTSIEEALTLASIVEKETGVAEERARIAGVFINRLRKGIRLQSDPTVIYGVTGGTGALGRKLYTRDLETPSPYNTYIITGLPPHPIANPGKDSLAAVLHPLETNELYFVADGTGGHVFSTTLAEHNRNVAQWYKIKRTLATGQ